MTEARRPLLIHLTSYAFTPRSHPGIHRQVLGLAPAFRNLVLCGDRAPYHAEPLSDAERASHRELGIESRELTFERLRKPGQIEWLAAGILARGGRPVALLAHLGNNGWRSLPLARALGIPIFTVFHGNDASVDLRDEAYAWRYRKLARAPGGQFRGVSGNIVDRLVEFGFPEAQCGITHLGVDLDRYAVAERRDPAPGSLEIVLAGRFLDFKGHRVALDALAGLRATHPGARLHLYGEGDLEPALRQQAADLGLGEAVLFHGVVPVTELHAAFARADVAIQPSVTAPDGRSEGVPNTVLEALATGLPVVGSRHAGIPEAVVDEETGLLVEENDAAGLEAALRRLAGDPALGRRLGDAGRRLVEREFDAVRQGVRLAADLTATVAAYGEIPAAERRAAWDDAATDLVEPPAEYGLRYRAAWRWKTLRNRVEGDLH
ncbi:MAG: glycosyltransferase [Myxococcales bacterium]|nr:glycosyltransferase [Myxococcales bacterium]